MAYLSPQIFSDIDFGKLLRCNKMLNKLPCFCSLKTADKKQDQPTNGASFLLGEASGPWKMDITTGRAKVEINWVSHSAGY